jgi:hypothetical protein
LDDVPSLQVTCPSAANAGTEEITNPSAATSAAPNIADLFMMAYPLSDTP